MVNRNTAIIFISFFVLLFLSAAQAQNNIEGGKDHPKIPRVKGTVLNGYAYTDFDEGRFITDFKKKKLVLEKPAGKRTRLFYLAPKDISGLQAEKNYEFALKKLGTVETPYKCAGNTCPSNLGSAFVWAKDNRIPVNLKGSSFFYATFGYRDQRYAYFAVTGDEARYHVSVYTAFLTGIQAPDVKGKRAIHVEILEEADFKATLEVVTPDEIATNIQEKGRIALYGIYFDFDSDVLKADSTPALQAIADAMKNQPELKIYVVGHTDNQGSYEYNLELSKNRAAAVTRALREKLGVAADRLKPIGVGPVAPVASNATEKGQALNRRVELVGF